MEPQKFTKDNLPPDVAFAMAAFAIGREKVDARFLHICNRPLDGQAIYEELCRIAPDNAELRTPRAQFEIVLLINKPKRRVSGG